MQVRKIISGATTWASRIYHQGTHIFAARTYEEDCFIASSQLLKSTLPEVRSWSELRKGLKESTYRNGKPVFENSIYDYDDYELSDLQRIILSAKTREQIKIKLGLTRALSQLSDKKGNPILNSFRMGHLVADVNTIEQAQVQLSLASKLSKLTDKNGACRLNPFGLSYLVSSATTPEQVAVKFDLAKALSPLKDKTGKPLLDSSYLGKAARLADTPEQANLIEGLVHLLAKDDDIIELQSVFENPHIRTVVDLNLNTPEEALSRLKYLSRTQDALYLSEETLTN